MIFLMIKLDYKLLIFILFYLFVGGLHGLRGKDS